MSMSFSVDYSATTNHKILDIHNYFNGKKKYKNVLVL